MKFYIKVLCLAIFLFNMSIFENIAFGFENNYQLLFAHHEHQHNLYAQDIDDESVLDGFDEDESDDNIDNDELENDENKNFEISLDGYVKGISHYNFAHEEPKSGETDWRGLSSLKTELQLALNVSLYDNWKFKASGKAFYDFIYMMNDEDDYTDEVLDNYEKDIELQELYIMGNLIGDLDIKVGRQIVVWGNADNLRVNDVLNPVDYQVFGLVDLEDIRLPITMSKVDYYAGPWNISLIAVHEIKSDKNPEFGSDYYPSDTKLPDNNTPESNAANTEYAAALNGVFTGWDISFYYANYYNSYAHVEMEDFELTREYERLNMFGSAYNVVLGSWILKAEVASVHGLKYFQTDDDKFSRTDVLVGFDFSGIKDTDITIEVLNRHIHKFDEILKDDPDNAKEDQFYAAYSIRTRFLNDTLEFQIFGIFYDLDADGGALQRYSLEYDVIDALSIKGGVIFYQSGEMTAFKNVAENDRLFAELKYSF